MILLDQDFEEEEGEIRCVLCLRYNPLEYAGKWMQRKSCKAHIGSQGHQKSLNLRVQEQQVHETLETTHARQEEQFLGAHSDFSTPLAAPPTIKNSPAIAISSAEEFMWREYELDKDIVFEAGDDPSLAAKRNWQAFEQQAEEYGLWAGLETMPDNPQGEEFWDENELDEDLELAPETGDLGKISQANIT